MCRETIPTKQQLKQNKVITKNMYCCSSVHVTFWKKKKTMVGKPGRNNWPRTKEREETRNPEVAEQSFECVRTSFQDNEVMDTRRLLPLLKPMAQQGKSPCVHSKMKCNNGESEDLREECWHRAEGSCSAAIIFCCSISGMGSKEGQT